MFSGARRHRCFRPRTHPEIAIRPSEDDTAAMPVLRRRWMPVVGVIAALSIAIPVMGADPSPSTVPSEPVSPAARPSGSQSAAPSEPVTPAVSPSGAQSMAPEDSPEHAAASPETEDSAPAPNTQSDPKAAKPPSEPKSPKVDQAPEVTVTVTGTVNQTTDAKGRPSFTIKDGSTTWELSAGPPWYWGDKNPLAAFAGKSVTVVGSAEHGGSELDVSTVDGSAIRAAGKPPWAGGPWVVGSIHPGWKPWMANGKPGKGSGAKTAPGQNKDKSPDSAVEGQPGS